RVLHAIVIDVLHHADHLAKISEVPNTVSQRGSWISPIFPRQVLRDQDYRPPFQEICPVVAATSDQPSPHGFQKSGRDVLESPQRRELPRRQLPAFDPHAVPIRWQSIGGYRAGKTHG